MQPIALYVHIPFCETKCPYCDFNTYAKIESLIPDYVEALRAEIHLWGELLNGPRVRTIFFGGGTPSYLPAEDISALMTSVIGSFEIDGDAEVTLEANPGDFSDAKLEHYLESGVNRLSIGVQSFDHELLKLLGRRHSVADAIEAYRMAGIVGFDNVSIDLMYGLPHQTVDHWNTTLARATDLNPPHISMYALTLEGGTPMEHSVTTGLLPTPDPDLAADMYEAAQNAFGEIGYRHYEISNWAMDGMESKHNLVYWRNEPYLGVGPGAHSYLGDHRFGNLKPPREYVRRLSSFTPSPLEGEGWGEGEDAQLLRSVSEDALTSAQHTRSDTPPSRGRGQEAAGDGGGKGFTPSPFTGEVRYVPTNRDYRRVGGWDGGAAAALIRSVPVVDTVEHIGRRLEMAETMMLGLRLDEGIDVGKFKIRFGESLLDVYKTEISDLEPTGLIDITDDSIRLTGKGRFLSNEVFIRFFG